MKKTCLLLLLLVGIIYINEGYKIISEDMPVKSTTEGSLSDVADEVIAIPLETTSDCRLKHATQIKRDRNELFLVSNGQLFISTAPANSLAGSPVISISWLPITSSIRSKSN